MWLKSESQTENLDVTEIVNMETQEKLTVATKDADRILELIQQRFVRVTADNKVYIVDSTGELLGFPTNLEADKLTPDDENHINDWLRYLNRG